MKPQVSKLTIARRFIPWVLVNYILMPLSVLLILIGYGQDVAEEFWKDLYGQ